jgi:site-specific recombinase XerC
MLSAERNAAANTHAAYRRDLEDASEFMVARKTALSDAATADLSAYLAASAKRGMAARSAARRSARAPAVLQVPGRRKCSVPTILRHARWTQARAPAAEAAR